AGVYARIDHSAARLAGAVEDAFAAEGSPVRVSRAGSLFSLAFRDGAVRDYDDAKDQDVWRYGAFFMSMLAQGISLPPSVFEAWFLSAAHTDVELDRIVAALPAAVRAAAVSDPRPEPAG
ncbi:MAG: aspartate aminotransferase family protein, partial [Microbacterium sp.]